MRVTRQGHLGAELPGVELLALLEEEGIGRQIGWRCEAVDGGTGGYQQHVTLATQGRIERCQSFGNQIVVWREAVVG
ncbi:MAG: hypothetical protein AW09_003883 [Candidatus Accumulibacter phosphatis]|uniref:Uncharacterized protein n=1 Tax=Candidatus Accumulibacter phosphatis TaxID=327160 RepID=A0A080LRW5_9PROT|nr:MAG: hypothetical protein AW09_003883 [Candidatus Accumulibacter phosphatis]